VKLPSLDTAEGMVLLGAVAVIAYMGWKATMLPGQIGDQLKSAGEAVSNGFHDLTNRDATRVNTPDTPVDASGKSVEDYIDQMYGLGVDSRAGSAPQTPSPSSVQIIGDLEGAW
jgi:hypothetical protein